jgi:hypothetical protein
MATIDRFLQRNRVSSTSPTIPIGLHRTILRSPA